MTYFPEDSIVIDERLFAPFADYGKLKHWLLVDERLNLIISILQQEINRFGGEKCECYSDAHNAEVTHRHFTFDHAFYQALAKAYAIQDGLPCTYCDDRPDDPYIFTCEKCKQGYDRDIETEIETLRHYFKECLIEKIHPDAMRGKRFTGNKRGPSQTTAELIEQLRMILMDIGPGASFYSVKRRIKDRVADRDSFFQEVDRESETVCFITSEGSEGKVTFKTIGNHLSFIRKKYFHK